MSGQGRRGTGRTCENGSMPASILVVDPRSPDEAREQEFEIAYLRSLTTQERFKMMFERSRLMAQELERRGYRKPAAITQRS